MNELLKCNLIETIQLAHNTHYKYCPADVFFAGLTQVFFIRELKYYTKND